MTAEVSPRHRAEHLLALHHGGQSPFQLEHFVIDQNGLTEWGRFKQILREIDARHQALDSHEEALGWRFPWRRLRPSQRRRIEQDVQRLQRELRQFYGALETSHGELLRDGPLTPERKRRLDGEFYVARFRLLAATDVLSNGCLSQGLLQSIVFLPNEFRGEVLEFVRQIRTTNPVEVLESMAKDPEYLVPTFTDPGDVTPDLPFDPEALTC